jgi:hypothetical protein
MSTTPYDPQYNYLHWNGNSMKLEAYSSDQNKVNEGKKRVLISFVRYSFLEGVTDQSIHHNHQQLLSSSMVTHAMNYCQHLNSGLDLPTPFDACIVSHVLSKNDCCLNSNSFFCFITLSLKIMFTTNPRSLIPTNSTSTIIYVVLRICHISTVTRSCLQYQIFVATIFIPVQ